MPGTNGGHAGRSGWSQQSEINSLFENMQEFLLLDPTSTWNLEENCEFPGTDNFKEGIMLLSFSANKWRLTAKLCLSIAIASKVQKL